MKLSIEGTIPHSLHFYGNTNFIKTNFALSHSNLILQAKNFKTTPESSAVFEMQNHKKLFFSTLVIDRHPPVISVLSHSPVIRTGGSAVVIYKVDEPYLKTTYIRDRIGKRFYAQPFITQNTFIVFIAWQVWLKTDHFDIIARDQAGNTSRLRLKISTLSRKYPTSQVVMTSRFMKQKSKELALSRTHFKTAREQYNYVTHAMKKEQKISIPKVTSMPPSLFRYGFRLQAFSPLKKAYITSGFGKLRKYLYHQKVMKHSYHLGVDLASTKQAEIISQNSGIVVYSGYNGGYGNTIVLSHGFGIYSLYSHCSKILFQTGNWVSAGSTIAHTGSTGFATGDHLHFGISLQGAYVNPREWMNSLWIKKSILNPIQEARQKIFKTLHP